METPRVRYIPPHPPAEQLVLDATPNGALFLADELLRLAGQQRARYAFAAAVQIYRAANRVATSQPTPEEADRLKDGIDRHLDSDVTMEEDEVEVEDNNNDEKEVGDGGDEEEEVDDNDDKEEEEVDNDNNEEEVDDDGDEEEEVDDDNNKEEVDDNTSEEEVDDNDEEEVDDNNKEEDEEDNNNNEK